MRFHVVTLGCDKNTVDSERYAAELVARGGDAVSDAAQADLVVVNTCGFIDAAKRESIDAILEAARLRDSGHCRLVAAVGCMVERHQAELTAALPEVDLFLGTSQVDGLVRAVEERGLFDGVTRREHPGVRLYSGDLPHVRYLKVSEGCDHGCAFCAIPLMRGRHRSFAPDDVEREAQLLELQGAREVNLVAQDLAHYGRDRRDGAALPELLERLLAETSIPWFRLLYIYSAGLSDRLLDLVAAQPRIVRYLDIPMQHADDAVLTRMRRPERRESQRARLARIRERIPGIAIRTTVIAGFPGETEAEFEALLRFLEEVRLDRVGAFAYSPQEGTRAHALPDDVPDEVKHERVERVLALQRLVTEERYDEMLGRTVRALVDRAPADGAAAQARIDGQADDIDGVTWLDVTVAPGTLVDVRLDEVVDSFDFRASVVGIRAAAPSGAPPGRRPLPIAPVTTGSYGRAAPLARPR